MTPSPSDEIRRRVRSPDPTLGASRPRMRPVTVERVPGVPAHLKGGDIDPPTKPRRQRVVLNSGSAPPATGRLRSRVELAQQTSWGEMLIKDLIGALLRSGLALAFLALMVVGGLPALFWYFPAAASFTVAGIPLAWPALAVGVLAVLYGMGVAYNRMAERHERAFVDMIES